MLNELEYCGIRGLSLNLFKSYFLNRTQVVEIENFSSNAIKTPFGVPQGTVPT